MISIDYQSKLPFYEQIAQHFQTLILRGALPPGSQMPSVRSLAVDLSINPNTIQKAYSLLEQEGYLRARIAVELNGEIIPGSQYGKMRLKDGDVLEVVSFVGGG